MMNAMMMTAPIALQDLDVYEFLPMKLLWGIHGNICIAFQKRLYQELRNNKTRRCQKASEYALQPERPRDRI